MMPFSNNLHQVRLTFKRLESHIIFKSLAASKPKGLGLWCLTPLSTILQLYRVSQTY